MLNQIKSLPTSWVAFELSILRRLDFRSVALPFTGNPALGHYLKRAGIRVLANDPLRSVWTEALASIQNNGEKLSEDDVNVVLEDVYVPGHRLSNPALRNWFSETDSWWFDNIRQNIDRLVSPFGSALAATLAMAAGDYVRSFTEETSELRRPLSNVFRRLWTVMPEPVNNGQNNSCHNKFARDFIAESTSADLMFLRLPATGSGRPTDNGRTIWREEWLRGGNAFWEEFTAERHGKLGSPVETKSQYLQLLEETLQTAAHIKKWAVAHVEGGFVSASDIVEVMGSVRRVDAVFTKDFTELAGTKAVIITA